MSIGLRRLGRASVVLMTLTLIAYLARDIDFATVGRMLERARPGWMAVAAAVPLTLGIALSAQRLRGILAAIQPKAHAPLFAVAQMSIVATALNNLTVAPAGELFRCAALRKFGIVIGSGIAAQAFEKVIEVTGLALLSAMMWVLFTIPDSILPPILFFTVVAALLAISARLVQSLAFRVRAPDPHERQRVSVRIIRRFLQALLKLAVSWRAFAAGRTWATALLWSMAAEGSNALSVAASLIALGVDVSPALCFSAVLGVRGAAAVISAPGHFGLQEAGMTMALVAFGVQAETAVAASILHHLCNLLPMLAAAGLITLDSWRRPRRPARSPALS